MKAPPPGPIGSLIGDDVEGILFNYPWLYFERVQELGTTTGWVLRPLGGWNYGYDEDYMCYSSWLIWALTTWGAVSNDYLEGLGLLAGAMYLNEQKWARETLIHSEMEVKTLGSGASWVHNVMAGYCWYHYYGKGKNSIPLRAASWAEIAGDLGAIVEETAMGTLYSHEAHYKGSMEGFAVAWALDILKGGRLKLSGQWWKPAAVVGMLIAANYITLGEIKNATKQR